MNKKTGEKKPRSRKSNSLSASSENITQVDNKPNLSHIIHFFEAFKCKNKHQKDFVNLINEKEIVIASGPAGVGKSYVTIARALELIKSPSTPYTKIILAKPAIEADEKHGFLPGTMREKMEPFISASLDIFDKLIGKPNRIALEQHEFLEIQPLAYIRGKSIDNTILILEEAQNTTPLQMKTLLTRIGNNSKFIISGDLDQSDKFKYVSQSGLYDILEKHKNIPEIGFITFDESEIVRNPIISKILGNYKKPPNTIIVEDKTIKKPKKTFWQKILWFLNQPYS